MSRHRGKEKTMFFRTEPYTDEDDNMIEPMDKRMIFASIEEGGDAEYVWDNIPAQAAREICDLHNLGR